MALKPSRSNNSISVLTRQTAEHIADRVETAINAYAREAFGNKYSIERFTETTWNVHEKTGIFSSSKPLLVQIMLADFSTQPWYPKTQGYYMNVQLMYLQDYYSETEKVEKIQRFCRALNDSTNLPIRCSGVSYEIPPLCIV